MRAGGRCGAVRGPEAERRVARTVGRARDEQERAHADGEPRLVRPCCERKQVKSQCTGQEPRRHGKITPTPESPLAHGRAHQSGATAAAGEQRGGSGGDGGGRRHDDVETLSFP